MSDQAARRLTVEPETPGVSEHYIATENSLVERELRTLKHDDAFGVFDAYGDIGAGGEGPEGLYFNDTRYLSRLDLRFNGKRPLLLGSVIEDDNAALSVDLANPDIAVHGSHALPRDSILIERTKLLWEAVAYERIGLRNYDGARHAFRIDLLFQADFKDLFEVRGMPRARAGRHSFAMAPDGVDLIYDGLDGLQRRTRVRFSPAPTRLEPGRATFAFDLAPGERATILVNVLCDGEREARAVPFLRAFRSTRRVLGAARRGVTIDSSNEVFDAVCTRAASDLAMLTSRTPHGLYPYAGIPWYSTAFGRDALITAMMMLWLDPSIARGVLRFLAATQARTFDAAADAQPGKILHETRRGEMARLREVPFGLYYGTVDATPLFVMLAGLYFDRTGDVATLRELWPQIEAALGWIETYGDRDGDGFVEYHRETETGLANQGWKDSFDSIFHADGQLARGPIALAEVQAYAYAARRHGARLAALMGETERATALSKAAADLQTRFDAAFWLDDLGTYALALDGEKRPCRVRTSNAGHALFAGIALPQRAPRLVAQLMSEDMFSGWGIRTVARGESRYNPISYHNGSIWPHDNAMVAMGLAHYGFMREAGRVFHGLFDAAGHHDQRRLPELFCGFRRRRHRGPVAYPVACVPQAWAAASPFAMLGACLGLDLAHERSEICFANPYLPHFLDDVCLHGLRLGDSRFDLRLHRYGDDVTVNVLARAGDARVTLVK